MAELLVRVVDREGPGSSKRGDVIVVCDDGWNWSDQEESASFWRILKVLGVNESELAFLGEPLIDADIGNVVFARRYGLDLDSDQISPAFAAYLADDTRAAPSFTLTADELNAIVREKPAPESFNVIG